MIVLNHLHIAEVETLSKFLKDKDLENCVRFIQNVLCLIRNFITNSMIDILISSNFSCLQELYLVNHKKGANELTSIPDFTLIQGLKILHLNNNKIIDIENSKTLLNVQQLDLRSNRVASLAQFFPLVNLSWLSLSSNSLTHVTDLPSLAKLKYLGLFANYLGQEDLETTALNVKMKCPDLVNLYISGNEYRNNDEIDFIFQKLGIKNEPTGDFLIVDTSS